MKVTFKYHKTGFHEYIGNPDHCCDGRYYLVTHDFHIGQIIFLNRCWRWRQSGCAVLNEDSLLPIAEKLKELNGTP